MATTSVTSGTTTSQNVNAGDTEYVLGGGVTSNQGVSGTRIVSSGGVVNNGYIASVASTPSSQADLPFRDISSPAACAPSVQAALP